MIKLETEANPWLMHFVCEGHISRAEYRSTVIPAVEKATTTDHKIRAFCDLRGMTSMELGALVDDFKLGTKYMKYMESCIVVGDQWWIPLVMFISRPFYKMELKNYPSCHYEKALSDFRDAKH